VGKGTAGAAAWPVVMAPAERAGPADTTQAASQRPCRCHRALSHTGSASSPNYLHTLASFSLGDGVRFNNPYRLRDDRQLGKPRESLSRAEAYLDWVGACSVLRPARRHGAVTAPLDSRLEGSPRRDEPLVTSRANASARTHRSIWRFGMTVSCGRI